MDVQEDKAWPAAVGGGPSYSHQRHSPLPSPIHPSQHHPAAVQPPISPPSAGDMPHHYMSYYYPPHPHQQQSSQSYYSYYTDSRAPPLRRADSSPNSTKPYYTSGFTMSSQPTTPRPSSSHSSPGDNHNSDETHPQTTSAQPQQQQQEQQEEVKHTNAVERPPVLPSLISPIHDQPTSPRGGGGKMRSSRSSDNSIPRHPRQSSASYGVEESGPKFGATKYAGNIYAVDRTTVLDVRIQSKFDRGFFVADNDWTCYRRNYFQVSATFSIQGFPLYYHHGQHDAELGCLVRSGEDDQLHEVRGFLVGISARVADDDKSIPLIQHTAKRDKGPQCSPEPKPIRPGGDLNLLTRVSSSPGALLDQSVVTFERIQFKSATANNGKRRAAQQYYVLLVELYAKLASGRLVKVASNRSAQLVVRGRSPGHYSERNGKEEGASETAGSSATAPTVLPSTNVHDSTNRGGVPSSIITAADYYHAAPPPPPPASASGYAYMSRDTSGSLPMVSPTFENSGVMRGGGGHDRSISAPSGPVDVYNHSSEQQHSEMNGYYKYAFYPRDHHPPPPSSPWSVHSRIASSGEPVSPYMTAPPPYYYNYYNNEHHQRSTSNNGPLNSPGVYQGSVPPSPYRSVSSQYEFPTNEQSPYHAQQQSGSNSSNFDSAPQQQQVKSASADE